MSRQHCRGTFRLTSGFVASLEDLERQHLRFVRDELVAMISSYRSLRPAIAEEINRSVLETKNQKITATFDRIVKGNRILRGIYTSAPENQEISNSYPLAR